MAPTPVSQESYGIQINMTEVGLSFDYQSALITIVSNFRERGWYDDFSEGDRGMNDDHIWDCLNDVITVQEIEDQIIDKLLERFNQDSNFWFQLFNTLLANPKDVHIGYAY